MEKPKCKLCGARHWSREPCAKLNGAEAETGALPSASADMQGVTAVRAEGSLPSVASPPVVGSNPTGPAKFDRLAYQREYMRKRRAALRETRGGKA
jgi:hypothetical protein